MGFRVNKRIKLAKGVYLNVGKKGISTSAKIGNVTLNSKGRVTASIPGTGISYSENLNKVKKKPKNTTPTERISKPVQQVKEQVNVSPREKNKAIAIILCLVFGVFGAHKFYEGKVLMGILYLFTCGLFFIGVLVDLINLIKKPSVYYV